MSTATQTRLTLSLDPDRECDCHADYRVMRGKWIAGWLVFSKHYQQWLPQIPGQAINTDEHFDCPAEGLAWMEEHV